MNVMKYFLLLLIFLMIMAGCSSEDMVTEVNSNAKKETNVENTSSPTQIISTNEWKKVSDHLNSDNRKSEVTQNIPVTTSPKIENHLEATSAPQVPSYQEDVILEEDQSEDFILIEDTKYINLMHEEKFIDWITVAKRYGAKLYAIPYSDVFAVVKDGEVLVGMSTGVANAKSDYINILGDLMSDKGEYAADIIEGIKHVNQTGESVHLVGPEEFDDDFTIFKQDDWIVVSW
ncbi:hypothetical protein V7111_17005 [Neobacillus niacini]|uniref:hypothetical protein n=1 Tax=Neobacillus niacini TaxID=86668 RepID=UPI0030032284